MTDKDFIKEVFQIAFGEGCMECDIPYDKEEVLEKLMEFSENAWLWEDLEHTYLLTVNGEKIKLCLYQDKDEISLEVEDDEDRDIDLEQIT